MGSDPPSTTPSISTSINGRDGHASTNGKHGSDDSAGVELLKRQLETSQGMVEQLRAKVMHLELEARAGSPKVPAIGTSFFESCGICTKFGICSYYET
jgi:hypothetical protein